MLQISVRHRGFAVHDGLLTPGFAAVHRQMFELLKRGDRVALLGHPGSGRTTILHALLMTLRGEGTAASLMQPGEPSPARSHVVLVDDADALGHDAWSALSRRRRPWVIAGLPSLRARVTGLRRLVIVPMPVVPPTEVPGFVGGFLDQSGEPAHLFSKLAVARLSVLSGGLPGRLAAIMRLAIFLARLEETAVVEARHVDQAASLGDETEDLPEAPAHAPLPPPLPARRGGLVSVLATVGMVGAILLPNRSNEPDHWLEVVASAMPIAPPSPVVPVVAVPAVQPRSYPLPQSTPLHVVLLVDGSSRSQARGIALAQTLRTDGYDVADPQPAPPGTAASEVRYYFTEDAATAAVLAQAAGIDVMTVRLAALPRGSLPRPGTVEIVTTTPPASGKAT